MSCHACTFREVVYQTIPIGGSSTVNCYGRCIADHDVIKVIEHGLLISSYYFLLVDMVRVDPSFFKKFSLLASVSSF